jgi:hypothetical protein
LGLISVLLAGPTCARTTSGGTKDASGTGGPAAAGSQGPSTWGKAFYKGKPLEPGTVP